LVEQRFCKAKVAGSSPAAGANAGNPVDEIRPGALSSLRAALLKRLDGYHRRGLGGVRTALRLALAGKDRAAPAMAEVRNLVLPGTDLPGRFYRPPNAEPGSPALLFFHGGGFVLGDLDVYDAMCRRLAQAGAIAVLSARYRLAPEAPFPAQLRDGEAWARWLRAQADALDIDPARIGLGGDSAGAYVAIAATAALNAAEPGSVAAQVLIYPLLQLDDEVWASSLLRHSRIVGRLTVRYIRAQLLEAGATIPSLLDADLAGAPPTLIVAGGMLDPVSPDCAAYFDKLRAAGALVRRLDYPPLMHGFANLTHVLPAARKATDEIGRVAGELLRG
jgi:acetyl esterase